MFIRSGISGCLSLETGLRGRRLPKVAAFSPGWSGIDAGAARAAVDPAPRRPAPVPHRSAPALAGRQRPARRAQLAAVHARGQYRISGPTRACMCDGRSSSARHGRDRPAKRRHRCARHVQDQLEERAQLDERGPLTLRTASRVGPILKHVRQDGRSQPGTPTACERARPSTQRGGHHGGSFSGVLEREAVYPDRRFWNLRRVRSASAGQVNEG
jgi:hypothetical protein